MSMGVFASFLVGWLMDRIGQVVCIALTILLGTLQLSVLVLLGNYEFGMIASFVLYIFFRQFLFPVYIAGITDRLGYKFFGLLIGIGFALAGVSQIFMASLVLAVQGNCHLMTTSYDTTNPAIDCFSGYWKQLHWTEVSLLAVLLVVPVFEHFDRAFQKSRVQEALLRGSFSNSSHSKIQYGSIQMSCDEHEQDSNTYIQ